jgi:CBS domain-containing protein
MDLRDLCQTAVATASPDDNVLEATWAMRENHVGDLVVVEEREDGRQLPLGIVTDRDIVIDLIAEGATDLKAERVGEVMSERLITANVHDTSEDVLEKMQAHGVRRIPIVRDDGSLFGIVTLDDMLSYLTNQMAALASVVGSEIGHEVAKDRG